MTNTIKVGLIGASWFMDLWFLGMDREQTAQMRIALKNKVL
jgi:hypothetical protein